MVNGFEDFFKRYEFQWRNAFDFRNRHTLELIKVMGRWR